MLKFTEYVFRATRVPSDKEVHCLWAHLTDKQATGFDFRIQRSGRLVRIYSPEALRAVSVELSDITFQYLHSRDGERPAYAQGDLVRVHGELSYSVHDTSSGKDFCPVDAIGQLRPRFGEVFLAYLAKHTGLNVESSDNAVCRFSKEDRSIPQDKVWLNDVIRFELMAQITDAAVFNSLAYRGIGRRKSYGLGNVFVSAHVAQNQLRAEESLQEA